MTNLSNWQLQRPLDARLPTLPCLPSGLLDIRTRPTCSAPVASEEAFKLLQIARHSNTTKLLTLFTLRRLQFSDGYSLLFWGSSVSVSPSTRSIPPRSPSAPIHPPSLVVPRSVPSKAMVIHPFDWTPRVTVSLPQLHRALALLPPAKRSLSCRAPFLL